MHWLFVTAIAFVGAMGRVRREVTKRNFKEETKVVLFVPVGTIGSVVESRFPTWQLLTLSGSRLKVQ